MPRDSASDGVLHVMFRVKGLKLIMTGLGMAKGLAAPVLPDTHLLADLPALFSAKTWNILEIQIFQNFC